MAWTLLIKGRQDWDGRGGVTSTHSTEQAAEDALREYVEENWDTHIGTDRPDENGIDDIVDLYFEDGNESYEIFEQPQVLDAIQPLTQLAGETEVYEAVCFTRAECKAIAEHFFLERGREGRKYEITRPHRSKRYYLRIQPDGTAE